MQDTTTRHHKKFFVIPLFKILCYAGLRNSRSAEFLNILINAEIRNLYKRDL